MENHPIGIAPVPRRRAPTGTGNNGALCSAMSPAPMHLYATPPSTPATPRIQSPYSPMVGRSQETGTYSESEDDDDNRRADIDFLSNNTQLSSLVTTGTSSGNSQIVNNDVQTDQDSFEHTDGNNFSDLITLNPGSLTEGRITYEETVQPPFDPNRPQELPFGEAFDNEFYFNTFEEWLVEELRNSHFIWDGLLVRNEIYSAAFNKYTETSTLSQAGKIFFEEFFSLEERNNNSISGKKKSKPNSQLNPMKLLAIERLLGYIKSQHNRGGTAQNSLPQSTTCKEMLDEALTDEEYEDVREKVFIQHRNQSRNKSSDGEGNQIEISCDPSRSPIEYTRGKYISAVKWAEIFSKRCLVVASQYAMNAMFSEEELKNKTVSGKGAGVSKKEKFTEEEKNIIARIVQQTQDKRNYPYEFILTADALIPDTIRKSVSNALINKKPNLKKRKSDEPLTNGKRPCSGTNNSSPHQQFPTVNSPTTYIPSGVAHQLSDVLYQLYVINFQNNFPPFSQQYFPQQDNNCTPNVFSPR